MARKSSAAGRLLAAGLAAVALCHLAGLAFVAPPRAPLRAEHGAAGAAVIAGVATAPQAASAAELTYDGFGPAELVAIFVPIVVVFLAYLEWESKQEPVDDITGVGTLGKTIDGPGKGFYFRRSEESG
mmetsp:Transcript_25036/g.77211  ORF Transcript_25036/g.77211 Transcript_25036/m.77211 type:complete len:128 (-) Transcript_25036:93-476(-)